MRIITDNEPRQCKYDPDEEDFERAVRDTSYDYNLNFPLSYVCKEYYCIKVAATFVTQVSRGVGEAGAVSKQGPSSAAVTAAEKNGEEARDGKAIIRGQFVDAGVLSETDTMNTIYEMRDCLHIHVALEACRCGAVTFMLPDCAPAQKLLLFSRSFLNNREIETGCDLSDEGGTAEDRYFMLFW